MVLGSGTKGSRSFFNFNPDERAKEVTRLQQMYLLRQRRTPPIVIACDVFEEPLLTTVIAAPRQIEKQRYADSLQPKNGATHLSNDYVDNLSPTSRLGPFQFDDSFLQTINEWQRRNAAGTSSGEISEVPSIVADPSSPSWTTVSSNPASPRTLLSIAAQNSTQSPGVAETASGGNKSTQASPSRQNMKNHLAKAIARDRMKQPSSGFTSPIASPPCQRLLSRFPSQKDVQSPAPSAEHSERLVKTGVQAPLVASQMAANRDTPGSRVQQPVKSQPTESVNSQSAPPWAAAMASISASAALRQRQTNRGRTDGLGSVQAPRRSNLADALALYRS